jgi:uncharacterized protein
MSSLETSDHIPPSENAKIQDLTPISQQDLTPVARRFRIADVYAFGSRAREIAARLRGEDRDVQTQGLAGHDASRHGSAPRDVQTQNLAARDALAQDSDVDIGVRPVRGTRFTVEDRVCLAMELEDLFEAKRVDLVVLPDADPFLALDVIRGELLYTEDPDDQARYELYVLRRAGDLAPFKKARMQMILEGHGR